MLIKDLINYENVAKINNYVFRSVIYPFGYYFFMPRIYCIKVRECNKRPVIDYLQFIKRKNKSPCYKRVNFSICIKKEILSLVRMIWGQG